MLLQLLSKVHPTLNESMTWHVLYDRGYGFFYSAGQEDTYFSPRRFSGGRCRQTNGNANTLVQIEHLPIAADLVNMRRKEAAYL